MTENPLLREISLLKDKIDGMGRVILKAGCRLTVDETVCISELMRKSEALEKSVVTINNYLGSPEADLSGYVTLATQQNITGQKNFDQRIGVGTRHPQNMLHINIPYEEYMGGIQITRGWVRYGDSDDGSDLGLNIRIAGSDALYSVSYTGRHFFNIETRPGVWETGMAIKDTPVNGPVINTPQIVVGEPTGMVNIGDTTGSMGIGSLNAEALYVNGEPVVTGTFDIGDYYTKTQLQTAQSAQVHWGNVTNAPSFITGIDWDEIGGNQSFVNVSGFNNDAGYLTSLPSHDHDTRYYTKTNLQTSGQASVHAGNITSGTLSDSRLSFNPDYLVQGETTRRSVSFNAANPIDNFNHSTLFRIDTDDSANPTGTEQYYGVKIQHPTADNYSVEIAGRIDNEKIFWGGLNSSGRQPWREIWHSGNLDTSDYYTKTNLQTSGQSSVHWDNLTNKPPTFPHASHGDTHAPGLPDTVFPTGTVGFLHYGDGITANPSWQWRYPTWSEITNKPSTFPHAKHASSHLPDESDAVFPSAENWGYLKYSPSDNFMEWRKPSWGDLENVPSVFPPTGHNHNASNINSGTLSDSRLSSNVFYKKTDIPGSADLNNYTDIGFYHQNSNTNAVSGTNYPTDNAGMLEVQSDGNMVYQRYTRYNTGEIYTRSYYNGTWYAWNKVWDNGNLDPSDYALVSHNHSASNINSGTLSNDRLSFNPDYFVQGTDSYRRDNYTSTNTLDDNNASGFFRLDPTDPANPDGTNTYYGFRTRHNYSYSVELAGRADNNKLWFGGLGSGIRQSWREIHHSGVNYIKYDNNPAEVSHPTTSENLGTSNQTLNPTKGIYYAPGRSDTQIITMGNPQYLGQTVEILHNGLQPLRVFCGPANPPLAIDVQGYSILRLRAVSTSGYSGWSPVI